MDRIYIPGGNNRFTVMGGNRVFNCKGLSARGVLAGRGGGEPCGDDVRGGRICSRITAAFCG